MQICNKKMSIGLFSPPPIVNVVKNCDFGSGGFPLSIMMECWVIVEICLKATTSIHSLNNTIHQKIFHQNGNINHTDLHSTYGFLIVHNDITVWMCLSDMPNSSLQNKFKNIPFFPGWSHTALMWTRFWYLIPTSSLYCVSSTSSYLW